MASIDTEERKQNLVKNAGVTVFKPRDTGTTNITRDAGPAGAFGPGSLYGVNAKGGLSDQFTDAQVANIIKAPKLYGGTTPTGPQTGMGMEGLLAALLGGGNRKGADASDVLARDKFNYEKEQDAKKLAGLSNYYTSGQYGTGFDKLLNMITEQGKVSDTAIQKAYTDALQNVTQGYDAAKTLGDKGFAALNEYIKANPNNPYSGMTASVGTPADALSNYLSAYGVSDLPVQGQIQADLLQTQQGAANFQNLLDTLSAVAQQGAGSRGAESEMAQLLFNTGLGQERAGYTSQAENARAQALAALQQAMYQSRFGVEQDRMNLANQLAQAVAAAGGTVTPSTAPVVPPQDDAAALAAQAAARQAAESKTRVNPSPSSSPVVPPPVTQKPIEALAARAAAATTANNPQLANKIEKFIEKNPNAGIKKIEKEFPKIAAQIRGK